MEFVGRANEKEKRNENYPGDQAGGKTPSSPSSGSNFSSYIISLLFVKHYNITRKNIHKHKKKRLTGKKQKWLIFLHSTLTDISDFDFVSKTVF